MRPRYSPHVPTGLTLKLANPAQVVLFTEELSGQISDGVWENSSPWEHWKWVPARENVFAVAPGEETGLRYLFPGFDGQGAQLIHWTPPRRYNFCNSLLLEVCADRMIEAVKAALPDHGWYTMKSLKMDLRLISEIVNGRK